jgi:hypothetical protein
MYLLAGKKVRGGSAPVKKNLLWAKNNKLHMLVKVCEKIRGRGKDARAIKKFKKILVAA